MHNIVCALKLTGIVIVAPSWSMQLLEGSLPPRVNVNPRGGVNDSLLRSLGPRARSKDREFQVWCVSRACVRACVLARVFTFSRFGRDDAGGLSCGSVQRGIYERRDVKR